MTSQPTAPATPPTLRALLDSFRQEILLALNCHEVGRIAAFDSDKQIASVEIASLTTLPDGSTTPYPLLTDCPVFFPNGGGGVLTFPVTVGDPCLVLFHDHDLDNWFSTGNAVAPNTRRSHSLSDGLVLVGFRNLSNPISDFSSDSVQLRYKGGMITLDVDGNLKVDTDGGATFESDTDGKWKLSNGATDLGAVMDDLFSVLTSWVNTGGSVPNPATVAAIALVKAKSESLLQ